jgi:hypothetical protein
MPVSQAGHEPEPVGDEHATIDDLARAQHAQPVDDPQELPAGIWDSGEELEARSSPA